MKLIVKGRFDTTAAKQAVDDLEVVEVMTTEEMIGASGDADAIVGVSAERLPELLQKAKGLRWIHTSSAGVDHLLCPELRDSQVLLTCGKDGTAGPNLADHAFGLLLALCRHISVAAREKSWKRRELTPGVWELGGKTLGIVGYGGAGRAMARRARAFGMDVLAVKRRPPGNPGADEITVWGAARLYDLLERSDAVMLALPGTPETERLLDAKAFRRMRSAAVLINVGRGTTVATDDLVAALRGGEIGGAGLDVTDPEPLPEGHPLWSMDRVVITPHIAGNAPERAVRNAKLVLENLQRFASGRNLLSVVDKKLGY